MQAANHQRDRLLSEAAEAQKAGRFEDAAVLCRKVLTLDPGCVPAKFLLGVLLANANDYMGAVACLSEVLEAEPRFHQGLVSLCNLRLEHGHIGEAIALAQRAAEVRPEDAHTCNLLGRALLADRRLREAESEFRRAITLNPAYAAAYHNLGKTVQWEGRDQEAADAFGRAAQISPTLENLIPLGQTFLTLCDFPRAENCARYCLASYPDSASVHLLLCGALIAQGQLQEADRHLHLAIDLDKDGREVLQLAERQRPLGYIEEANENLRRAISMNPRHVSAYDSLMHNQKVTEKDRDLVDKMGELLQDGNRGPTEIISLHYGLGKAKEDLGEHREAMHHYDEANRVSRKMKIGDGAFSREDYTEHVDRQLEATAQYGASDFEAADPSCMAILIIGMMRSGTTLAEQIISSHPKVQPAGEQLYWSRNWTRSLTGGPDSAISLGREYLAVLSQMGPDAQKVTDKMPGNYHFAGLIHRSLPNARIIHMRRSPADTCLSLWATPNHVPPEGGHDKAATVFVYKEYLRMMGHWRKLLPSNRFLEIDYEQLVSNREETTRHMVAFCGLEWDDSCLQPENNVRLVTTPSLWQVRQPVYKTSVERWRKFEPWLGEFRELLDLSHPKTL